MAVLRKAFYKRIIMWGYDVMVAYGIWGAEERFKSDISNCVKDSLIGRAVED